MNDEETSNKWFYSLTPEEEALCARIGFARQEPYLGAPQANRNYSEGDTWEIWQHIIAVGSELAFAKMVGVPDFIPHVNKWKTEQDVPGYEIRYSFQKKNENFPKWAMRYHERDHDSHIYVLLTEGLEIKKRRNASDGYVSHPYKAVGWMWGYECRQDKYESPFPGKYKNWSVPYQDLHSMSLLGAEVAA